MQVIDGAKIEYEPGYIMDCQAIASPTDPYPFNFLDYYEHRTARELALECSRFVTQTVLGWRDEKVENAIPLPQVEDIYEFITNQLGMEPRGKLAYVSHLEGATMSGKTTYLDRRAVVIRDMIVENFDEHSPALSEGEKEFFNNLRVWGVAAHELTHLAGAQDKLFFTIKPEDPTTITYINCSSTPLQNVPYLRNGLYFEEGLSNLVGSMYLWKLLPRVALKNAAEIFQSPKGISLEVPLRINLSGHQEYALCAWGIERLVALAPDIWDILMTSRKYGQRSSTIRGALRRSINQKVPGLFEIIDTTDVDNLDNLMETTERIVFEAENKNQ